METELAVIRHVIPGQHIRENYNGLRHQSGEVQIAVNQYVPRAQPQPLPETALTIIGLHGNGFPKECYEPLWEDIYARLCDRGISVRGFWVADCAAQGASGVLNEDIVGDSGQEHCYNKPTATNLFQLTGLIILAICSIWVHLSILHPQLLSSIILYEPIIFDAAGVAGLPHPSLMSTMRRDVWATREAAESSLRKGFNKLDPRVLDRYLKHGLRNVPTGIYKPGDTISTPAGRPSKTDSKASTSTSIPTTAVTLTTSKHQEAWAYADLNMDPPDAQLDRLLRGDWDANEEWPRRTGRPECSLALRELEHVRPSTLFVFGDKSPFSQAREQDLKLKITGSGRGGSGGHNVGAVQKQVINGAGHLLVLENVDKAADFGTEWISHSLERWSRERAILRSHSSHKSEDGAMVKVSQEWVNTTRMPADSPRPRQGKL